MADIRLKVAVKEVDDAVVMCSVEFPTVIVQGKNLEEAREEFVKSLDHMFQAQAAIYGDRQQYYPLIDADRIETITLSTAAGSTVSVSGERT